MEYEEERRGSESDLVTRAFDEGCTHGFGCGFDQGQEQFIEDLYKYFGVLAGRGVIDGVSAMLLFDEIKLMHDGSK